jgi:hypothetical protein
MDAKFACIYLLLIHCWRIAGVFQIFFIKDCNSLIAHHHGVETCIDVPKSIRERASTIIELWVKSPSLSPPISSSFSGIHKVRRFDMMSVD